MDCNPRVQGTQGRRVATPNREQPFWGFGCNTPFHFFFGVRERPHTRQLCMCEWGLCTDATRLWTTLRTPRADNFWLDNKADPLRSGERAVGLSQDLGGAKPMQPNIHCQHVMPDARALRALWPLRYSVAPSHAVCPLGGEHLSKLPNSCATFVPLYTIILPHGNAFSPLASLHSPPIPFGRVCYGF